jgi:hypothetical protein
MAINIENIKHGSYIEEFDGYSDYIKVDDKLITLYDALKLGIAGNIEFDDCEHMHIEGDKFPTTYYNIDFENCTISFKTVAPEEFGDFVISTDTRKVDYSIEYNYIRIEFAPKKYKFIFENTITGESGDVIMDATAYNGEFRVKLMYLSKRNFY